MVAIERRGAEAGSQILPAAEDRVGRICAGDAGLRELVDRIVTIARAGLPTMLRPELHSFAHSLRQTPGGATLAGTSTRYSAIATLGSRFLEEGEQRALLGGESAHDFCGRLLDGCSDLHDLGAIALAVWAAAELGHARLPAAVAHLRERWARVPSAHTVDAAWALAAFVAAAPRVPEAARDAVSLRERLAAAFSQRANVFSHFVDASRAPWHRRHVTTFADQVYPIQALARHHRLLGDPAALDLAERCADRICRLQGAAGQWWWHYDARAGDVIEGYPVYSVHQDAMAPMALLDLHDAGGGERSEAIARGLRWLAQPPEVDRSMLDAERGVIWRKVARAEPGKLVRGLRAGLTRARPGLRWGALDRLFPPLTIDYECRPYHLGWVLYAWLGGR